VAVAAVLSMMELHQAAQAVAVLALELILQLQMQLPEQPILAAAVVVEI
jgi:hypothetical protein